MKQLTVHILLLSAIAGALFFTNLGSARLWDRDEPRNAGCAAEMMARGDWIVPTFNDELRYQKPVLTYWFMMSAYAVFGTTEFAARFWSALLGIGSVLLTYGIGRRLFHPNVGLLAGIVLASSTMFDVAARAATPDSYLIFFSTLAIYFYVIETFRREVLVDEETGERIYGDLELVEENSWFPTSWFAALPIYAAMGVGVLAKGPVGVVLPTAIIGMFLLIKRLPKLKKTYWNTQGWFGKLTLACIRPFHPWHFLKTCWVMRPLTAIGIVSLIAAPWYVLVGLKTNGDFTRIFFLSENFGRATTVMENHSGGIWYYPMTLLLGFFPWSVLWLPLVIGVDRNLTKSKTSASPALVLLLCWVGVQVGLFSFASTKLPSYVTPCYPALALLTGWWLHQWITEAMPIGKMWVKLANASLIFSGLLVAAGLGIVGWKFLGGAVWLAAFAATLIIGGSVALWATYMNRRTMTVVTLAVTSVAFCLAVFGFGTKVVSQFRTSQEILDIAKMQHREIPLATFGCMESSWVVYASRPIYELDMQRGRQDQPVERKNWWDPKPRVTPESFTNKFDSVMFITTKEHLDELQSRLPDSYGVVCQTKYFLRDESLVLVAPIKTTSDPQVSKKSNSQLTSVAEPTQPSSLLAQSQGNSPHYENRLSGDGKKLSENNDSHEQKPLIRR